MRLPRASRYVASNLLVPVDLKYCYSTFSVGAFVPYCGMEKRRQPLFRAVVRGPGFYSLNKSPGHERQTADNPLNLRVNPWQFG